MSVQPSHSSVERGQNISYVVVVSTKNGSAADVSLTLTTDPASQKVAFTSGCAKSAKAATCTVGSVADSKAVNIGAQVPASSSATSVSSVKLTATASIVTTATWKPPTAAATVAITSASASPTTSAASVLPETALPVGPIPSLNNVSSSLIGAGNASGLFPAISPSATPTPSASAAHAHAQATRRNAESVADSSTLAPVLTAQIAGLIALATALLLTMTRLSLRRLFRPGK